MARGAWRRARGAWRMALVYAQAIDQPWRMARGARKFYKKIKQRQIRPALAHY
jgi:hypothetical protein